MADDLTHDVNHYRTTSGYTENSLALDANAVESSVVPSGLGKEQKLAEYIYQLFTSYHSDNRADGQSIAKLYADLTYHRVYDMLNDFYIDIQSLKADDKNSSVPDDGIIKQKIAKIEQDIQKLLSNSAPTLQHVLKNSKLLEEIKTIVSQILSSIWTKSYNKIELIADTTDEIRNIVKETNAKVDNISSASTTEGERKLNYNKVDDKTLNVLNAAIATALAPVKKALASIQKATTANNGLLQYSTQVVKNIDNNLASYANQQTIKEVNRKIQITEFKADDAKYRGIMPQKPTRNKDAFKSGFDFGKALPKNVAYALFALPVLGLFKIGSLGFNVIKKAFGVILSPLVFLVKGIGQALSFILTPIKFILGVVTGLGSFIFGAFSFLFKGALSVLNGIFKITTGIFKGVFKVISGVFSFIPKAISGIFSTTFGLVKGIWNMSAGILKWTKRSILDNLKTPAGRATLSFIAGFIYGFIIKPIKEGGLGKWIKTVAGAAYDGLIKVWDWARDNVLNPLCRYVSEELWPKLQEWIVGIYSNWQPTTTVGKAVKGTIDWVIDLWSDETGPNMKGFFGKNGAFTSWIDSIKKWWDGLHEDGKFFGKGGTWEKWFGDGTNDNTGVFGQWYNKFTGEDGLLAAVSKWMKDWFIGDGGKPGKVQQYYDKWFKDGGYIDGLKDAFSGDAAKRADAMSRGDWVSQIAKIYDWVNENLIGPSVKFGAGIIDLLTGKITISQLVDESEAFKKIKTISIGVGGGLIGGKIGSLFGPWGALIGAAVGAGAGLIYDAIQNAETARKANFERLQQGKELLNEGQFSDSDRQTMYKLYGSSYITPEMNKSLEQRLLEHSSKIKELREKYEAHTTNNLEKTQILPDIARHTKLYELTYKAKNGLYDDLAKYEKDYNEVKNRKIGEYRKRGVLEDVESYERMKDSWQHFGYTSVGLGGLQYADIDKMTTDAAEKRIEQLESMNENKISRVNQVMEKLKQTGFYSKIGAESPEERRRLDQVLRNIIAGNSKFTSGEWRLFGDNDWEKKENLEAIQKEIETIKDRKDGLFEKILGKYKESEDKAKIQATKEAAEREGYERGVKDGASAAAAGAAANSHSQKIPSLGSSIVDNYSITK